MAISLPRLSAAEFLSSATWNSAMALIESEFALPATLAWPVLAGGTLDMQDNEIINVSQFWNVYNAASYDSWQDVLDAVAVDGKGCIIIPPDTTIETRGATLNASDVLIMGYGSSSVLKGTASGVGTFMMSTSGDSNITLLNFTLDINNVATVNGIEFDGASNVTIDKVTAKNAAAGLEAFHFVNADNTNINIVNCPELDGMHIERLTNFVTSNSNITGAITATQVSAGQAVKQFKFTACEFDATTFTATDTNPLSDDASQISFNSCRFKDTPLSVTGFRDVVLSDTRHYAVSSTAKGVELFDCENLDLNNVRLKDWADDIGLDVHDCRGTITVNGVTAENCGNAVGTAPAIRLDTVGSTHISANGLISKDSNYRGVLLSGLFASATINGLVIDNAADAGFYLDMAGIGDKLVTITNPVVLNCTGDAGEISATPNGGDLIHVIGGVYSGNNGGAGDFMFRDGAFGDENLQVNSSMADPGGTTRNNGILHVSATWNTGVINEENVQTTTVTVNGVNTTGDHMIMVDHSDISAGRDNIVLYGYVSAANTVTVVAHNSVAAAAGTLSLTGTVYVTCIPAQGA